ncbi:DHS-like NAD/FAD-binding domain-containing protein [Mytilinidion resinicola]|uniref:DHS-like NAD/FAD-binding domain-containing protein n=1 Tax=Mytilinidion resinicola TaxID=574789 RepID=A0A6A6YWS7_9PEZI|nr:DHS-like NAD/FAD-binding domain-containing protein [Mytilinidion resinicola]KAF2813392.1 DHS-like NAD/FAD-binding domain-containing protein [Mytilinidion resinicola]
MDTSFHHFDFGSDGGSSPVSSVPSRSPSPPTEFCYSARSYPSPSASQQSSAEASPAPDPMTTAAPSGDDDGPPPAKRRKISEPKPRTTERLDLRYGEVSDAEKPQLERLLKVLHKKRKIVVIAGAGISVSAGIPDFRSSTGLFKSLRKSQNLRSSGKDLFDASVYQDDQSTTSFHEMVRELSQATKQAQPTAFHHLLATLAHEGRLLRLYSQNVDGIDTSLEPLKTEVPLPKKAPWPKTVQLHGGLDKMVCSKCHKLSDFEAGLFDGPIPPSCAECVTNDEVRAAVNKRSHGIGRLRPRMVLYNEHNPDDEAIGSVTRMDLRTRPDAIIVAGTTLKVPGVRRITREMCGVVRDRRDGMTVWINNDPEPIGKDLENCWDLIVRGPCDEVARYAGMPRWDDHSEAEFKVVTDEELRKAKENTAEVVVVSPMKPKAFEQVQGQLVTPVASPRMAPRTSIEPPPSIQGSSTPTKRKIIPTSKAAALMNASEAADSKPVLKPAPKKRLSIPKTSIPPKTVTKATKPTKKTGPKPRTNKITGAFGVSKSTTSKTTAKQTMKLNMSLRQEETINVSPKKIVAVEVPIPMAPISPQAARNNASPLHNPPTPTRSPEMKLLLPVATVSTPEHSTTVKDTRITISPTGTLPRDLARFVD